jgi:acyl dehydratase
MSPWTPVRINLRRRSARSTAAPFEEILVTQATEASVPTFSSLKVGDVSPPLVTDKLSRTMFVKYAGASGDFNPMHHDDTIATQVGNPSVFGHGMLTAGLLARVVKDWFGPTAMRKFAVRFSKQVWPGDVLTCTATITAVHPEGDGGLVDLDLLVKNGDDVSVLSGTAAVALDK